MRKSLFLLVAFVASGVLVAAEVVNDDIVIATAKGPYQAFARSEIVELGEKDGTPIQSGKHHEVRKLTHGLNWLGSAGWELVAIEPGRTVPITGPAGSTRTYEPTYIFRKKD